MKPTGSHFPEPRFWIASGLLTIQELFGKRHFNE